MAAGTSRYLPQVNCPYAYIHFSNDLNIYTGGEFFVGLTHKRIQDKANTVDIQLSYPVRAGENPNALEEALVASGGNFTFSYGHSIETRTPTFVALLIDYSVRFSNGILTYSLSGISKAVTSNYDLASVVIPADATPSQVLLTFNEVASKVGYQFAETESFNNIKLPSSGINIQMRQSVIATLQDAANLFTSKSNEKNNFIIVVSDTLSGDNDVPKLILKEVQPDAPVNERYSFVWNAKDADVISWTPQYKGVIAIAKARTPNTQDLGISQVPVLGSENEIKTWFTSTDRLLRTGFGTTEAYSQNEEVYNQTWWSKNAQYPYVADLTVIGNPEVIEIGDFIDVNPLLPGGTPHHSKGKYRVLSVTDSIGSNGFTTSYHLVRYSDSDLPVPEDVSSKRLLIKKSDITRSNNGLVVNYLK